jgi:hypothetical protein
LYNSALVELGEEILASLLEDRKARYVLDSIYAQVKAECLAVGSWNFAVRDVRLTADAAVTEHYGFSETFAKPTDWVRTVSVSEDENYQQPLLRYKDEVNYLAADTSPIYLLYVSNDIDFGENLAAWPQAYARYVVTQLAERSCMSITQNEQRHDKLERFTLIKAKRTALNQDIIAEPTKFFPENSWNASRHSGTGGRGDRGKLNRLIG